MMDVILQITSCSPSLIRSPLTADVTNSAEMRMLQGAIHAIIRQIWLLVLSVILPVVIGKSE